MRRCAGGLVALAACYMAAFLAAPWNYHCDQLTNFLYQAFWATLLLAILLAIARAWRLLVATMLLICIQLAQLMPFSALGSAIKGTASAFAAAKPATATGEAARAGELKLLNANVLWVNKNKKGLRRLIEKHKPDVICLQEADQKWIEGLRKIEVDYPYSFPDSVSRVFETALYSRIPLTNARAIDLNRTGRIVVCANVVVESTTITLINAHTFPPFDPQIWASRNEMLESLARLINEEKASHPENPIILAGDLNVGPWSPHFRKFRNQVGLDDARHGFRLAPTWPVEYKMWPQQFSPMMIPIDHVLHSPTLRPIDIRTLTPIGSDHLPLLVRFAVRN